MHKLNSYFPLSALVRLSISICLLFLLVCTKATAQDNEPKLSKLSEHFAKESGFDIISGEVKNLSQQKLDNVEAVTTLYDKHHNVIKISEALIEYNPILPGQTSPYKTTTTDNPDITREFTTFKFLMGGMIKTTQTANAPSSKSSRRRQSELAAIRRREKLAYIAEGKSFQANARRSLPEIEQFRVVLAQRGYMDRYIRSVKTQADSGTDGKVGVTVTPTFLQLPNSQRVSLQREMEKMWIDIYRGKDDPCAEIMTAGFQPASQATSNPVGENREYQVALTKHGYMGRYIRSVSPVVDEGIEGVIIMPAFAKLPKTEQLSIQREIEKMWINIYTGPGFPEVSIGTSADSWN